MSEPLRLGAYCVGGCLGSFSMGLGCVVVVGRLYGSPSHGEFVMGGREHVMGGLAPPIHCEGGLGKKGRGLGEQAILWMFLVRKSSGKTEGREAELESPSTDSRIMLRP
jgi:hypothetical protein